MGQLKKVNHLLHEAVFVYLRPYWTLHLLLAVTVMAAVGLEIGLTLVIKFLIDEALIPHDLTKLQVALGVLVLLFVLAVGARVLLAVIRAYLTFELSRDLRISTFHILQRLPSTYYDRAQPGELAPIFDTELLTLMRMLRDLVAGGLHAVLRFLVVMTAFFLLNWQLALVVLALLSLLVLRTQRRLEPTIEARNRLRLIAERVNSAVLDYVSTQPLFRAFGMRMHAANAFTESVVLRKGPRSMLWRYADLRSLLRTAAFLEGAFQRAMGHQQGLIQLVVVVFGAFLTFTGSLTLGAFSAFIILIPTLIQAITNSADYIEDLGRATLSLGRLERIANAAVPPAATDIVASLPVPTQAIRFEQVNFGYTDGASHLTDVTLTLPIGQSAAFVGRSGAGKSTLLKLLLGFYDPDSGRVLIDNHDVRNLDERSRSSHIGTVLQQSFLTNTTIRNNICFAKPEATDEEVEEAASAAGIHRFIAGLPNGYESEVGEGGKWLSEGQRQRIALARAILTDPTILLLDEVTASLDPESEAAINATIEELAANRTVLLVTHRLASATFVDRLVVVDQGRIHEEGSHEELLAKRGLYFRLWQLQTGFLVSADGQHAEVRGERLRAIPLFRGVDITTLDELATRFVSEFFRPGNVLYEEGESGDKFYIVVRGTVSVSTSAAEDHIIRLADLQDGDYFGEGEMLNRGRRTTTVRASTSTLCLSLHADHFHRMMNELSSLRKIMTQTALGRSLTTICSVGRRRRDHPIWQELAQSDEAKSKESVH